MQGLVLDFLLLIAGLSGWSRTNTLSEKITVVHTAKKKKKKLNTGGQRGNKEALTSNRV